MTKRAIEVSKERVLYWLRREYIDIPDSAEVYLKREKLDDGQHAVEFVFVFDDQRE